LKYSSPRSSRTTAEVGKARRSAATSSESNTI
jgi:hypothetical protein